jgi:hypothetical protein
LAKQPPKKTDSKKSLTDAKLISAEFDRISKTAEKLYLDGQGAGDRQSRILQEISELLNEQAEIQRLINEQSEHAAANYIRKKDNLKSVLDLLMQANIQETHSRDLSSEINEFAKMHVQTLSKTPDILKDTITRYEGIVIEAAKGNQISGTMLDIERQHLSVLDELHKAEVQILSSVDDIAQGQYKSYDIASKMEKNASMLKFIEKERLNLAEGFSTYSQEELDLLSERTKEQIGLVDNLKEMDDLSQKMSVASEKTLGVWGKFVDLDFKGGMQKMLGLDTIQSEMKKKIGGSLADVARSVASGEGLSGALSSAGGALKTMIGMAPKFLMALGIGFLVSAIQFLVSGLMELDTEISEIGTQFGVGREEAVQLHKSSVDIASEMGIAGIKSKEVAKAMQTASENMNGLNVAGMIASGNKKMEQMVKDTAVLSEKFQMSNEEIKSIQNFAAMSGKSVGEVSNEAIKLGKGIMSGKEAMKTLASIPPSVQVSFKGSTQELLKAAQKAKLLGMELSKVQSIGDGMLEIEDSLGKEMEARALTGRDLNLDAARQYALQGDTARLQDEILKQAGSLGEFQKMNRIQQKSFADAMGMSVDEMTNMLTASEKLKDVGLDSVKLQEIENMNEEELAKEIANTGDLKKKNYLIDIQKQRETASLQEKFQSSLAKIKEQLIKMAAPLLEIAHSLLDSVQQGGFLEDAMTTIKGIVSNVVPVVSAIFKVLQSTVGPIMKMLSGLFSVDKTTGEVQASFGGVASVLGIVAGFFVGKALLTKGMDMLKEKAVDAGKAIMDKVGGSISKVAEKGKDSLGKMMPGKSAKVKTPSKGSGGGIGDMVGDIVNKIDPKKAIAGAFAILILAGALWVAAKAFQEFAKVNWEAIAKGVVGMALLVAAAFAIDKVKTQIIGGAVALGILSLALIGMAIGFTLFSKVDWGGIAKGVVAIAAVAVIAVLLGKVAPLAHAGAGALYVLGAAMVLFGAGMYLLAQSAEKIIPAITGIIDSIGAIVGTVVDGINALARTFVELLKLDPKNLPALAAGIIGVAGALGALGMATGGGGIMNGIGAAVSGLFGSSGPMEMIMDLTKKIDPSRLSSLGIAIKDLASAFRFFAEETSKLKDIDLDMVDDIIDRLEDAQSAKLSADVGASITGAVGSIGSAISGLFSSSPQKNSDKIDGGSQGGGTDKLDAVIQLLTKIAGTTDQPTVIKFGDKTIEEFKTQLSFKKAYNIGVDNSYGRSV